MKAAAGLIGRLVGISIAILVLTLGAESPAAAQEPDDADLANANNPLADIKAFNVQNYYIPKLYGVDNEIANTFWFRFAAPTGRVLWRASLPLRTVPTGGDPESGLGDFDIFAAYLAVQKPTLTLGLGPQLVAPTASNDALGTGRWQVGLAAVAFAVLSPQLQTGGLVVWQTDFAGDSDRAGTNVLGIQPFGFWQLGGGTYLRTAPIWAFNLETGDYHVPFGFGIGQVTTVGRTVFNIFLEPQFTLLHEGIGQPAFQIFTALNMQFK